jgi:hypothetical protein
MQIGDTTRYGIDNPNDWAKLLPAHGHLVNIDGKSYTVAMFHQLKCLDIVRHDYAAKKGPTDLSRHCLNYLRQTLLCHSDTRLESIRSPFRPK